MGVAARDAPRISQTALLLPTLLYVAHHPAVTNTARSSKSLWRTVVKQLLEAATPPVQTFPADDAADVFTPPPAHPLHALLRAPDVALATQALIRGRWGVFSPCVAHRTAATGAVVALLRSASGRALVGDAVLPGLVAQFTDALPKLANFNTEDVEVWRWAEGVLYAPNSGDDDGSYGGPAQPSKNVRRERLGKKGRGGFVDEDELYLEKLSADMKAKKRGTAATLPGGIKPDLAAAKVTEQAETRKEVEAAVQAVQPVLHLLEAVARANPLFLSPRCTTLLAKLQPSLQQPLGRVVARSATVAVVAAAFKHSPLVAPFADDVAEDVATVMSAAVPALTSGPSMAAVVSCLCRECLPDIQVSPITLSGAMPVLAAVLQRSPALRLHQPVLALLALHAALPPPVKEAALAAAKACGAADDGLTALGKPLPGTWATQDTFDAADAVLTEYAAACSDFAPVTAPSVSPALGLQYLFSHRKVRSQVCSALLHALRIVPRANPAVRHGDCVA